MAHRRSHGHCHVHIVDLPRFFSHVRSLLCVSPPHVIPSNSLCPYSFTMPCLLVEIVPRACSLTRSALSPAHLTTVYRITFKPGESGRAIPTSSGSSGPDPYVAFPHGVSEYLVGPFRAWCVVPGTLDQSRCDEFNLMGWVWIFAALMFMAITYQIVEGWTRCVLHCSCVGAAFACGLGGMSCCGVKG